MVLRCPHCKRICLKREFYEEHQKVHELVRLENLKLTRNAAINADVGNVPGISSANAGMEVLEIVTASSASDSPMEISHLEIIEEGKTDANNRTKEAYPQEIENDPLAVENDPVEAENDVIEAENDVVEVENDFVEVEDDPLAVEPRYMEDSDQKVEQGKHSKSAVSNSLIVAPVAAIPMEEDASEVEIIDVVDHSTTCNSEYSKEFTCTHCANIFPSHPLYLNHLFTHFEKQQCPECPESFDNVGEFDVHMIEHKVSVNTASPRYMKCGKCNAPFTSQKIIVQHNANAHSRSDALTCHKCKSTFPKMINYQYHVLKHVGRSIHICYEFCGLVFDNKVALDKHILFHKNCENSNELNPLYQCYDCAITFLDKLFLLEHRYMVHETQKPFYCDKCDEVYYDEKLFHAHSCFREGL